MEEMREKILYLKNVMKFSFRQIGDQIGISHKRVSKIYKNAYPVKKVKKISRLDRYYSLIADWFNDYPKLKALQVYEWLRERDVEISYTRVVQYTKQFREKKEKIYHDLTFLPGEEAQVDWFFTSIPGLGKVCGFAVILSYSRYLFAHFFPRSSFEFFIEGHLKAFDFFEGYPQSLRYDNLRSVVLKRKPEIQYNPRFLEFCRHYKIGIRLCNPASGNEKGRIERSIRSIKETFVNTAEHSSFTSANHALYQWVEKKNNAIHRTTKQTPLDMKKEENLRNLPEIAYKNISIHPPVKTTKTGMIIFDTNSYSAPDYLTGKSLSIHSCVSCIKIYDKTKEVASHPRIYEKHKKIINPLHRTYSRMSQSAKSQRIYEVIKNLDPEVTRFLIQNQSCGEDPQKTAYEIFKLLKSNSRIMLIGIVSECLKRKSARLKTLLSYLHMESGETIDKVQPKNPELLNIDYNKRSLEEYNEQT